MTMESNVENKRIEEKKIARKDGKDRLLWNKMKKKGGTMQFINTKVWIHEWMLVTRLRIHALQTSCVNIFY
jgi:hypothetical protein